MNLAKKIFLISILLFNFSLSFAIPQPWVWQQNNQTNSSQTNTSQPDWWAVNLASKEDIKSKMSNPTFAENTQNKLWVNSWDDINWDWWILTKIIKFARESIFNLLWVIIVWVLLFIWFRLIIARWTPDIFKKAIMWLVYLVIWVVLIYTSWAMVKIILWTSF